MKTKKINILKLFVILNCLPVFAQTGPGGIGSPSTNILWLSGHSGVYSDSGNTPCVNYGAVLQWKDISGNSRHAYQTNPGNKPQFVSQYGNGFPALRFLGNQFVDVLPLGIAGNSSVSYIIVFTDTAHTNPATGSLVNGTGEYFLDRWSPIGSPLYDLKIVAGDYYGFQKRDNAGGGLGGVKSSTTVNTSTKFIDISRNYGVDYRFSYNGVVQDSLIDADGPTTPSAPRIGRLSVTANAGIKGYIHEVICFNTKLNAAQKIILNNYLSAKYKIALSSNDLYTMDNPSNGDYDYEVAGIGRVNAGNQHTDAQGSAILKIYNPSNLDNNEFLIWGHDNGSTSFGNTSDVPGRVQARMNRVWRVSEVNTSGSPVDVGSLTVQVAYSGPNYGKERYCLLVDTDNDGLFSDEIPIMGANWGVYQSILEFKNVKMITDRTRFTFGYLPPLGYSGPGGVGSALTNKVWLAADKGVYSDLGVTEAANNGSVAQWNDFSGNVNHAYQIDSPTNSPKYKRFTVANGMPGLRFTGNSYISNANVLDIDSFASPTIIAVFTDTAYKVPAVGLIGSNNAMGEYIYDRYAETHNGLMSLKTIAGDRYGYQRRSNGIGNSDGAQSTTKVNSSTKFISLSRNFNSNIFLFYNGVMEDSVGDNSNGITIDRPRIGRNGAAYNQGIKGYIHEFMIFDANLNSAQKIIVDNYISAKYNINLSSNDLYTMDDASNGSYDYDMAGIGRISNHSHHMDAQGSGLVRINNPSGLSDGEFLLWGHNNLPLEFGNTSDVPYGIYGRSNRIWRVSEVNTSGIPVDVGAVDLEFSLFELPDHDSVDLDSAVLLVDTDNDGMFADEFPVQWSLKTGSHVIEFNSFTGLTNGASFTIASRRLIPLPVSIISAQADCHGKYTNLSWAISSTEAYNANNIYGSKDGKEWKKIGTIHGQDNYDVLTNYNYIDSFSGRQFVYYKIVQVDRDGKTLDTKLLKNPCAPDFTNRISIFPNINSGHFNISGLQEDDILVIQNALGVELQRFKIGSDAMELNISEYDNGLYYLTVINSESSSTFKISKIE